MKYFFPAIRTVLLFTGLVLSSCSDSWLEPDPKSFFAPKNVYVNEAGFQAGLVTLRKNLNYDFAGNRNPISAEYSYSDIAVSGFQSDFRQNTPSNSQFLPILSFFTAVYEYIKNANVLISRIDDIEWPREETRNMILAEAYWHRAYWYYRLVNTYGDVPWIGIELKGTKLDFQSTSRDAILKKIQADLEYAVQWLPVKPGALGDVTKGAANHLLTKVYLANTEFDKAIASATAVIDGPYRLMQSRFGSYADDPVRNVLWDLHRSENKNNPQNTETIYTTVDRADGPPEAWTAGAHTMRLYTPSWWAILDATGNRACNWDTRTGDTLGIGNADVRTNNYWHYTIWNENGYNWKTTPDLRRADINWVEMTEILTCRSGSPQIGLSLSKDYFSNLADTVGRWYPWPIYKTFIPTPNHTQPLGGQSDMYIFRLAETYLLRAEAYLWKGAASLAADDINEVRARAKAKPVAVSDVSIDFIFDERSKELYIEEPRHSEMVRVSFIIARLNLNGYGLAGFSSKNWYYDRVMRVNHFYHPPIFFNFGFQATLEPHNVLWPVPQSAITANTLGVINQNIGYAGADRNIAPLETIQD